MNYVEKFKNLIGAADLCSILVCTLRILYGMLSYIIIYYIAMNIRYLRGRHVCRTKKMKINRSSLPREA